MKQNNWLDILLATEKDHMTDKQIQIVAAAIELFGEKGYAATSTKEIAQRAQVAEGTIFKHYATKKDLLLNVSTLILNNMLFPIINYGLDDLIGKSYLHLEEFIEALLSNRLALIQDNIILLKVVLQEALFQPEIRLALIDKLNQVSLSKGLEALKEQGLIIDRPTRELIILIMNSLFSFIFTRYLFLPEMFAQDQEADRQNFIHFMVRALKPENQNP